MFRSPTPRAAGRGLLDGLPLMLLVISLAACRTAKPLATVPSSYRIVASEDDHLLLPPPVPAKYAASDTVSLPLNVTPRRHKASCTAEGRFFRLAASPDKRSLLLTLPSLKTWQETLLASQSGAASDAFLAEIGGFFDRLRALERNGCLPTGTALPIRDLVLASLPMRPNQGLFANYGYWAGKGVMDLRAGLRLEVERAYYRDTAINAAAKSLANYIGTSDATYEIDEKQGRAIQFRLNGIAFKPQELQKRRDRGIPDFTLARQAGSAPFYRLLLAADFVPDRIKRSALLVGAATIEQINAVTAAFQARHGLGCSDLTQTASVICVEFDGEVTVSPEVRVLVNGQTRYLTWGSTIRRLLSEQNDDAAARLKTLRVERLFDSQYSAIRFAPGDEGILELALVGGDRVSW